MIDASSVEIIPFETTDNDNKNIKEDISFKIIVIGDSGVGKSCLSLKGVRNVFHDTYAITVNFDILSLYLKINSQIIKLQIWDICGNEKYRSLISSYYRQATLCVIVYSIDKASSFDSLNTWIKNVYTHASPECRLFLIGNKADLEDSRVVPYEEGKLFAEKHKCDLFMETSAKTGLNAKELFVQCGLLVYRDYLENQKKKELNINDDKLMKITNNNIKSIQLNSDDYDEEYINRNESCC
jgi:Ras-related protein Rab-1A